jgi:3-oxo-5alpha-steroid 4-dehydrogenase
VLVVGFGCAGGAAAYEVATAGADVLIVERAGEPGGASAISGGEVYLGGGTAVQRAGSTTRRTTCSPSSAPRSGRAPTRRSSGCTATGAWSTSSGSAGLGLTFNPSLYQGQTWLPPTEDGLTWVGENAYPYDVIADPCPAGTARTSSP